MLEGYRGFGQKQGGHHGDPGESGAMREMWLFPESCVGGVRGTETWSLWFLPSWAEPGLKSALGTRNLFCEAQSVTCWGRTGHSWDKTPNWSTIVV